MFLMEEFNHLKIQLQDIISATDNFSPNNLIGHGGFGKVYKGEISVSGGRTMVAIKRLDRKFGQGNTEFWKEIMMLSNCKHENLVSLLHFCFEGDERILVYEYASRGSLDRHLSDVNLTWIQRLKICVGAARGLNYLHDPRDTKQRVLHRDIKSSNILLDEEWNAKVSDFGLSKVGPANQPQTYLVSNVVGTFGYCDPSYFETGLLSKESDVYSFGVVLFEVMCGRLCCEYRNGEMIHILVPMWRKCFEENKLDDIIFSSLKEQIQHDSLMTFSTIANRCLHRDHKRRPTMVDVVHELEIAVEQQLGVNKIEASNEIKLQQPISEPSTSSLVKSDELRQDIGLKEPLIFVLVSIEKCWWAFDQGFSSGRKLPVLPSGSFNAEARASVCGGTHLLVSGEDIKGFVIWRYELETNKWYKAPSMINRRRLFASATCGNSAYMAGGITAVGGRMSGTLQAAEKYDPETRSWTPLPRMIKPRKQASGCYMDNRFYVIGGSNEVEGQLRCGEFYDQKREQWRLIKGMLKDLKAVQSVDCPPFIAVVNNELYLIESSSNKLKVYLKKINSWITLGVVPVWVGDNDGQPVAFTSIGNELLLIGESTIGSLRSPLPIYSCTPEPQLSDHLPPKWKLRDYSDIQLNNYIINCTVMQ